MAKSKLKPKIAVLYSHLSSWESRLIIFMESEKKKKKKTLQAVLDAVFEILVVK